MSDLRCCFCVAPRVRWGRGLRVRRAGMVRPPRLARVARFARPSACAIALRRGGRIRCRSACVATVIAFLRWVCWLLRSVSPALPLLRLSGLCSGLGARCLCPPIAPVAHHCRRRPVPRRPAARALASVCVCPSRAPPPGSASGCASSCLPPIVLRSGAVPCAAVALIPGLLDPAPAPAASAWCSSAASRRSGVL